MVGYGAPPRRREGSQCASRLTSHIPQNTGTILRLAACLGVEAHIIEPAGFPVTHLEFRRAGMDYLAAATIVRHTDWRRSKPGGTRPARGYRIHHPGAHIVSE